MKELIDRIVSEKAKGNSFQESNIKFKLMLKGIPLKAIDASTPEDPDILDRIFSAAKDFNIQLNP